MIEVSGVRSAECQDAVDYALNTIADRFPEHSDKMLQDVTVEIGDGITDSGGETDIENKHIALDATKNARSLQDVEDQLVLEGMLEPGDWTSVLPETKDKPWSTLTYNLVHEIGHTLVGYLDPALSPTKYGRISLSNNDALPEAFAYYVFGGSIAPEAEEYIVNNWGRS